MSAKHAEARLKSGTGFLEHALELAERGRGTTHPNPMVGAVVVRDGEVVGEGWHKRKGGPHGEIVALEAAGRRRSTAVAGLCAALGSLYLATLAIPFTREFFALAAPDPVIFATALTGASLAVAGLAVTSEAFLPGRR